MMTIEQIIKYLPAPICGNTVIGKEEQKEYDAHDSAVIILRKYQKIEQIIRNYDVAWEFYHMKSTIDKIRDVIGDGNDK